MLARLFDKETFSKAPKSVVYALIALPAAASVLYVYAFGVNGIVGDQFQVVQIFSRLAAGNLGFENLAAFHNEHHIFFPRLAMLSLGELTDFNNLAEMYAVQACLLATMAVLFFAFRRSSGLPMLLFVPVAFLVFSLRQFENMLWGFQITFVFAQVFSVAALYSLYLATEGKRPAITLPLAVASAFVATFSSLPGLMVWPAGACLVLVSRAVNRVRLAAAWLVCGVASWALYFFDYETRPQAPPFLGYIVGNPVETALYFPTSLGASLMWHRPLALVAGAGILFLFAVAVWFSHRRGTLRENAFWIGVVLFSLGVLAVITAGRASLGPQSAMAPRYSSFSLLAVISVYVMLMKLVLDTVAVDFRDIASRAVAPLAAAFLVALALIIPATYLGGYLVGARNEATMTQAAEALQNAEATPEARLEILLRQPPDFIRQNAEILDRLDYNVFAEEPSDEETGEAASPAPSVSPAGRT